MQERYSPGDIVHPGAGPGDCNTRKPSNTDYAYIRSGSKDGACIASLRHCAWSISSCASD
jgi:hypothetical protein